MRRPVSSMFGVRAAVRGATVPALVVAVAWAGNAAGAPPSKAKRKEVVSRDYADAREIFNAYRVPGQSGEAGGDGLGPLYNEHSCVGCHHLGGVGGAGANGHNVDLLTALVGAASGKPDFIGELEDLHPGFKGRTSIVVHAHSADPAEDQRLETIRGTRLVQTRNELVRLVPSSRNTPALFGAGLIDSVPDNMLLQAEKRTFAKFPEIKGRVSRLADGSLGRFGWKGQTTSLHEFVLAACSNELGLEVPGHHQVSLAADKDFDPKSLKLDLDAHQCALLTEFVRTLPRPIFRPITDVALVQRGALVFETVGCATCHTPTLGRIDGLYSDLLLHDLGDRMSASGSGYSGSNRRGMIDLAQGKDAVRPTGEAGPNEWRTPPLWGVAASAPYMHDGRAFTLDDAVRLHGGEAAKTSDRYADLPVLDRHALLGFLQSLRAPTSPKRQTALAKRSPSLGPIEAVSDRESD